MEIPIDSIAKRHMDLSILFSEVKQAKAKRDLNKARWLIKKMQIIESEAQMEIRVLNELLEATGNDILRRFYANL